MSENNIEWNGPEPSPQPKKNGKKLLAILGSVILVLAVIGGSYFGYEVYQENQREEAAAAAKAERVAAKKAAARKVAKERKVCESELGDYLDSLEDIDSRLDVGVNQEELSNLTGDASSEENDVDEDVLPEWCADAKDYADDALSAYSTSVMDWSDCIWDDWCDPDYDIDLQGPWMDASQAISRATEIVEDAASGEVT